jgi:sulfotransferase
MAGLPRSGSTVLSALLNQHPSIYASPQTDLVSMLYELNEIIPQYESYKAGLVEPGYNKVLNELANSFYSHIKKPIVIDKNRGWGTPYNFNNLSKFVNPQGKIILTMRPILDVLASFIKISQSSEKITGLTPFLSSDMFAANYRPSIDAQCDFLMMPNGELDKAIYSIANLLKNHKDKVHVIWFDEMLTNSKLTMKNLYKFLELPDFENDFDNILEVDIHNDLSGYQIAGLHDIEKKLYKPKTNPEQYLSNYVIDKYKNALDVLNW